VLEVSSECNPLKKMNEGKRSIEWKSGFIVSFCITGSKKNVALHRLDRVDLIRQIYRYLRSNILRFFRNLMVIVESHD
jgi:hypothetical protein